MLKHSGAPITPENRTEGAARASGLSHTLMWDVFKTSENKSNYLFMRTLDDHAPEW